MEKLSEQYWLCGRSDSLEMAGSRPSAAPAKQLVSPHSGPSRDSEADMQRVSRTMPCEDGTGCEVKRQTMALLTQAKSARNYAASQKADGNIN